MSNDDLIINRSTLPVRHPDGSCVLCGCTEERPCAGGCCWYDDDLCSACVFRLQEILDRPRSSEGLVVSMIDEEANPNILAVALANASGDWRRAAVRRRQSEIAPCS